VTDRKPRRKREAHTAESLQPAAPVEKEDAVQKLLGTLYALALEGNVTAAKLYLDYCAKQKGEDTNALTPEEALRIIQEARR
jgi:hypothetical protein